MSCELLILRHGKSDWSSGTDDFNRPLKDRGKRGAQRIGSWLQQQRLIPDLILCSPAERARTTAEKCCKAMGKATDIVQCDPRIYLAQRQDLMTVLQEIPPTVGRVMLVGHNPGLESLLEFLADDPIDWPEDGKLLPTATLARLQISKGWGRLQQGRGKLVEIRRPTSLDKKFPFPAPDGEEFRDRPAYYYTQSSVIPYQITDERLEIMIVRSSKKKHWVVPKGIGDPGYALQDSAKKEAWEEAGIEGEVDEQPIGQYYYQKWGAECAVSVFSMRVTQVLSESEWEESHRGRKWVSPEEAADCLKQPALGPLVMALKSKLEVG